MNVWVGIDISKDFFDVTWVEDGHRHHVQLANRDEGFRAPERARPPRIFGWGGRSVQLGQGELFLDLEARERANPAI